MNFNARNYVLWKDFKAEDVTFALGHDKGGKPTVHMLAGAQCTDVALVSPACVTNWPRVTGDGNFGTLWGPTDISKAKFSLDLTDGKITSSEDEPEFGQFAEMLTVIDDKLLDFVHGNQLKLLGRKNLARDEVKMLQIRTVRPKYDKVSGALIGHAVQLSAPKFAWDGMGGKMERRITICDQSGTVLPNATVTPGDVVSSTMFANQVYTGVGGDKFGIHWSFEDVSVVCQRAKIVSTKTSVSAFTAQQYKFGQDYEAQPGLSAQPGTSEIEQMQFSD